MRSVRIPLNSRKYPGLFAVIDEEDYELVSQYRWYPRVRSNGVYAVTKILQENTYRDLYLHRLLTDAQHGDIVDHANRDTLDNRRQNLRKTDIYGNNRNAGIRSDNQSGYRGVSWHPRQKRWIARIKENGKDRYLGAFRDPEEAALVYDTHARRVFGEFASLNFTERGIQLESEDEHE